MNSKGQALLETCVSLPIIIALFNGMAFLIFFTGSYFLADYWVYQANICLGSYEPRLLCQRDLKRKLHKIPMIHFQVNSLSRNIRRTYVSVNIQGPGGIDLKVSDSLRLPLKSKDFSKY